MERGVSVELRTFEWKHVIFAYFSTRLSHASKHAHDVLGILFMCGPAHVGMRGTHMDANERCMMLFAGIKLRLLELLCRESTLRGRAS